MSTTSTSISQDSTQAVGAGLVLPPWLSIIIAIVSVQMGAAIATQLFDTAGSGGVVFLRTALSGLFFVVVTRPRLWGYSLQIYGLSLVYGATIGLNMLAFYLAIARIPLGVTVAIAFIGPLTISVLGSRRASDLLWVALAAIGIMLLSPITDTSLDIIGVGLAFVCSFAWTAFILLSKRIGNLLPGNTMLTLSMCMAALVSAPFGAVESLAVLAEPVLILLALVVALFSAIIPFWLELKAIKQLPVRVFGLLMSLEPAVAALIGWIFLHNLLGIEKVAGIALVTIASIATSRSAGH